MKEKISKTFNKIVGIIKRKPKQSFSVFALFLFLPFAVSFAGTGWFELNVFDLVLYGISAGIAFFTGLLVSAATAILTIVVALFDNILVITISNKFYEMEYIKVTWGIIRDFANIAFIIGIIIIGFYMMFGKAEWKKMLLNLVIVAFVMNFSIFIGRVIAGAGNFTTAIFYSISAHEESGAGARLYPAKVVLGGEDPYFGWRNLGTSFIQYINMGDMITSKALDKVVQKSDMEKKVTKVDDDTLDLDKYKKKAMADVFFTIMAIFFAKTLLETSFLLVSRMIYLIRWIITAPIYFARYFLPKGQGAIMEWFSEISQKAFCMVSFMAGVWILTIFMQTTQGAWTPNGGAGDIFSTLVVLMIKFFIIREALKILNGFATKQCGDGSGHTPGFLSSALGIATGFVGGGLGAKALGSMLGRTVGRGAVGKAGLAVGRWTNKLHTSKTLAGRYMGQLGQRAENKLYNYQIGGKSFKDEVARSDKEEAQILSRLSEDKKKERFYNQMGGRNIRYDDDELTEKEARKEVKRRAKKMADADKREKYLRRANSMLDDKYINKASDQAHLITGRDTAFQRAEDWIRENKYNAAAQGLGTGIGVGTIGAALAPSALAALVGGAVVGGAAKVVTGLAIADVKEAERQRFEKQKLSAGFKDEEKELKEEIKKLNNKDRKEKKSSKDAGYANKQRIEKLKNQDIDSENVLQQQIKKMYEAIGESNVDVNQAITKLVSDSRFETFGTTEKQVIDNYLDAKSQINVFEHQLTDKETKINSLENKYNQLQETMKERDINGDSTVEALKAEKKIEDVKADIKMAKDAYSSIEENIHTKEEELKKVEKNVNKIIRGTHETAKHIIDETTNEKTERIDKEYSGEKKDKEESLKRLEVQYKENQEDIMSGREARHPSKHNIVKHVSTNN